MAAVEVARVAAAVAVEAPRRRLPPRLETAEDRPRAARPNLAAAAAEAGPVPAPVVPPTVAVAVRSTRVVVDLAAVAAEVVAADEEAGADVVPAVKSASRPPPRSSTLPWTTTG